MGKGNNKEILSGDDWDATALSERDAFIGKIDMEAFRKDIDDLGKKLADNQGPADVVHLEKIINWSRMANWIGALTCWIAINPVSIFLMSLGNMSRWTMVAHHVCHGGFDKCSEGKYNRFKFGLGTVYQRCKDWLDWMLVEAWNQEHNQLHHYHLSEVADPDLVEHNMATLRNMSIPVPAKYVVAFFMALTWKWFYYAPNTYKQLKVNQLRRAGVFVDEVVATEPCTINMGFILFGHPLFSFPEFFIKVLSPYLFVRFVLTPLPFFLLDHYINGSYHYAMNAFISIVLAEAMTNLHSFVVIATNHAGDDLYRFNVHCKPHSGTFYLRQVISSANFTCGTDSVDFMHGWLNYQVEHHLWPQLSMLSYQRSQPIVEQICKKHGIPYIKHNVFWRLHKLLEIMVGTKSMRKYPLAFENKEDCKSD